MTKRNLSLPKEGDVVVVAGHIEGEVMREAVGENPVGTCVFLTEDGKVAVLFPNSYLWWGQVRDVFLHEEKT